jgi:hypothetical protein
VLKKLVEKLMLDRDAWSSGITMIAKESTASNSERSGTRSNIIVEYYFIELRDIITRIVFVV